MNLAFPIIKSTKSRYFVPLLSKVTSLFRRSFQLQKNYYSQKIMAQSFSGQNLKDILKNLEEFAPLNYAESWDNVGLLVDPMESNLIRNILLTNDLTEEIVEEAVKFEAGLIITYHPNIFLPLKTVTSNNWKQRIVINCIKNKIAVFSPHTSWDSVRGGVNDWLASGFLLTNSIPIKLNETNQEVGPGRFCYLEKSITVREVVTIVKKLTGLPYLRLATAKNKNEEDTISTIALCAGAGSSLLNGVSADLYLTGEMLHHDILDATQKGIHVILCNHSDSERGFLKHFSTKLQKEILGNKVQVFVSQLDRDPLKTV